MSCGCCGSCGSCGNIYQQKYQNCQCQNGQCSCSNGGETDNPAVNEVGASPCSNGGCCGCSKCGNALNGQDKTAGSNNKAASSGLPSSNVLLDSYKYSYGSIFLDA